MVKLLTRSIKSCLLIIVSATAANAQVTWDSTNPSGIFAASGTTTSFNVTTTATTAGSDRVGLLGCAVGDVSVVTGATWNGSAMTQLVSRTNGTDGRGVVIYWIAAPPTTSSTVNISFSGGGTTVVCGVGSVNAAHQTVQDGNTNGADYTTTPTTLSCTRNTNELVFDFVYALNGGAVPTASGGTKLNHSDQGTWYGAGSYNTSSGSMGWDITGITRASEACVSIKPASAASVRCCGGPMKGLIH